MGDIPTTTVVSLILFLLGFFATVTSITLYYYKKYSRRLERLELIQRATEGSEASLAAQWQEKPVIWEVQADRYPELISKWEDLLPLNMTCDHDQLSTRWTSLPQSPLLQTPNSRGWRSAGGAAGVQLRQRESSEGPEPTSVTTDYNISVLIAMPTPRKQLSIEFGDGFAIGTAGVVHHHPKDSHP